MRPPASRTWSATRRAAYRRRSCAASIATSAPRTDPGPPPCAVRMKRISSARRRHRGSVFAQDVLDLVGQLLDPVLGLATGLVDFALPPEAVVAADAACGLLDTTLGVVLVA